MNRWPRLIVCLLAGPLLAAEAPPWQQDYAEQSIAGFSVRVLRQLDAPERVGLRDEFLAVLHADLLIMRRVLPREVVPRLQQIPIWCGATNDSSSACCYHPSAGWLRNNGWPEYLARGVHLVSPEKFLAWHGNQPFEVLHEFAHAWQDQVLGNEHRGIAAAFDAAVASGTYTNVLFVGGGTQRHYALTNAKEYFAEGTEAWFGRNDFYPFNRAELERHDPQLSKLMREVWRPIPASQNSAARQ